MLFSFILKSIASFLFFILYTLSFLLFYYVFRLFVVAMRSWRCICNMPSRPTTGILSISPSIRSLAIGSCCPPFDICQGLCARTHDWMNWQFVTKWWYFDSKCCIMIQNSFYSFTFCQFRKVLTNKLKENWMNIHQNVIPLHSKTSCSSVKRL